MLTYLKVSFSEHGGKTQRKPKSLNMDNKEKVLKLATLTNFRLPPGHSACSSLSTYKLSSNGS